MASTTPPPPLDSVESRIHALYDTKDSSQSEMKEKVAELKRLLVSTGKEMEIGMAGQSDALRVRLLFLRGKLLDCLDGYQAEAETLLIECVKLDPSSVDVWNCLGHCLWKKGAADLSLAQSCIGKALAIRRNAESLRLQSQIMRQAAPAGSPNRMQAVKTSIDLAKEAVSLNARDAVSWYVLGNAYLVHFFEGSRDPKDLSAAMKAYSVAGADVRASNIPDLHFNRGNLHSYLEEYDAALQCYKRAALIDKDWPEPVARAQTMIKLLQTTSGLLEKYRTSKKAKLESLAQSVVLPSDLESNGRRLMDVSDLTLGENPRTIVATRLLSLVPNEEPQICVAITHAATVVSLSLYGMTPKILKEGDTITLLDPLYRTNHISLKDNVVKYDCLAATAATNCLVNGQPGASLVMIHGSLPVPGVPQGQGQGQS